MKNLISIAFLLVCNFLHAQEKITPDTLIEESRDKFHVFIAPSYSGSQFVETMASQAGIAIGLDFKDRLDLRIYYGFVVDNFKKKIIFPRFFTYDQMNGGIYVNYYFTDHKISPLVGVGAKYGNISWRDDEGLDDQYTDHLLIYDAYLGGIWKFNNAFSFQFNFGYTISSKVNLIGLNTEDFQGMKCDLAIIIRAFSF